MMKLVINQMTYNRLHVKIDIKEREIMRTCFFIPLLILAFAFIFPQPIQAENGYTPNRTNFDYSVWETLPIQEGGLEKSLYTFAEEFVRDVTGKSEFNDNPAIENLFSMAFEPHQWTHKPFIKIRLPALKEAFGVKHERITPMDLEERRAQWQPLVQDKIQMKDGRILVGQIPPKSEDTEHANAHDHVDFFYQGELMEIPNDQIEKIDPKNAAAEKEMHSLFQKAGMVFGDADFSPPIPSASERLAIVPTVNFRGQKDVWLSIEELLSNKKNKTPEEEDLIVSYDAVRSAYLKGDATRFNSSSQNTVDAISNLGVPMFRPVWKFSLDRWDSRVGLFGWAGWTYLVSALVFLVSYLAGKRLYTILAGATLALGSVMHISALIIRGILAGRTPVANLFEASVFIIACITIFSLGFSIFYRSRIVGLGGATLGAFFMGMANIIPLHMGRKILPLIDALQSYWLHIHVTSMLISYAFFATAFFVALAYVGRYILLRNRPGFNVAEDSVLKYLDSLNFRIITIGVPVLTGGVILGAVWAAEAWGRPWAFDPKETAAAITWMIYVLYLHSRLFLGWRGMRGILVSIIGFGAVIFTYLGVSFFLPGLHSYVSDGISFGQFLKNIIPGI